MQESLRCTAEYLQSIQASMETDPDTLTNLGTLSGQWKTLYKFIKPVTVICFKESETNRLGC